MLFGATGQVGQEIAAAAPMFPSVILLPQTRAQADLSAPGAAAEVIRRAAPDAVINAAAWTKVDQAESEPRAAFRINADAAGEIAAAARAVGARLVHLSTDYVFPGEGDTPLDESAPTGPVNVYGASKLEGEDCVRAVNPDAVILRTSWVYSAYGSNFVKTMLHLARTRAEIDVVSDQIGGPTPASAIAMACLVMATNTGGPSGLYHFQGAPAASWADFAKAIFAAASKPVRVNEIGTLAYPAPAPRPLYTVLSCNRILRDYGINQPDWRIDIARKIGEFDKKSR